MSKPVGIIIPGANGRMGRAIINLVAQDAEVQLLAAIENTASSVIGADAGLNAGSSKLSVVIQDQFASALEHENAVIIEFTAIEATLEHLQLAAQKQIPMVIGTTGFDEKQVAHIKELARSLPVVLAPNMSIGMNLMFKLIGDAATVLKDDYDIEVFEAHHKHKKDSPSGTANRLAQILCQTTERDYPNDINYHREGVIGARPKREIGMQVIRGGDIVGEHTVYYCGEGERIEIKHVATSRNTFASGALRAAKWLHQQKPGLYDMWDVLGLRQ